MLNKLQIEPIMELWWRDGKHISNNISGRYGDLLKKARAAQLTD